MDDYEALLKRARDNLPDIISDHQRFQIPKAEVINEGKLTIIRNFVEICNTLNREPEHVLAFLLRELGTSGNMEGRRVIFKGRILESRINERIEEYAYTYVICSECGRPDTVLGKEGRTLILKCTACGAHRPVKVRKTTHVAKEETGIKVGDVYELPILSMGRQGDGIARKDNFVIFVPGTRKGNVYKIKIEKVSKNTAFGKVVVE